MATLSRSAFQDCGHSFSVQCTSLAEGVWTHAAASLLLAFLTFGLSWILYPFYARQALQTNYLRKGWIPISPEEVYEQTDGRAGRRPR